MEGVAKILAPHQLNAKSFDLAYILVWQKMAYNKQALSFTGRATF
jgi:hypothetical protein